MGTPLNRCGMHILFTLGLMVFLTGVRFWAPPPANGAVQADHVVLFVLEGVSNKAIRSGVLPVLHRLATEGSVTWSATSLSPPLSVSSMASLLTGLPVRRHRITQEWERYDFSRSFLRAPTMFDYLDLAGGRDTALFLMDERFYQLARPEIYVDSQVCGKAKPECRPATLVIYIRDYLKKVMSEGGHGFRLFEVPGLLVAHLPAASQAGAKYGWNSSSYQEALKAVDSAIHDTMNMYSEFGVLDHTMIVVTGLNSGEINTTQVNGAGGTTDDNRSAIVPWLAWGANVKSGHQIQQEVSILDTGATILEALGLETHTEWESHTIHEIFKTVPERRTTGNEMAPR